MTDQKLNLDELEGKRRDAYGSLEATPTLEKMKPCSASSECPVCGANEPHAHHQGELQKWTNDQLARFGYAAIVFDAATKDHAFREQLRRAWQSGHSAGFDDACYQYQNPSSDRRATNPHGESGQGR